jgi:hypothetical protein
MLYSYIRSKAVRQLIKEHGKRCGHSFLAALDKYVYEKILRCVKEHNGNRKTLDDSLVNLTK